MPPFEYKPFINPYIGSISELMGKGDEAKAAALIRIGEIQARAAEQQGQAWGNAIQGLGNIAGKAFTDYAQEKKDAPRLAQEATIRQASVDAANDVSEIRRGKQFVGSLRQAPDPDYQPDPTTGQSRLPGPPSPDNRDIYEIGQYGVKMMNPQLAEQRLVEAGFGAHINQLMPLVDDQNKRNTEFLAGKRRVMGQAAQDALTIYRTTPGDESPTAWRTAVAFAGNSMVNNNVIRAEDLEDLIARGEPLNREGREAILFSLMKQGGAETTFEAPGQNRFVDGMAAGTTGAKPLTLEEKEAAAFATPAALRTPEEAAMVEGVRARAEAGRAPVVPTFSVATSGMVNGREVFFRTTSDGKTMDMEGNPWSGPIPTPVRSDAGRQPWQWVSRATGADGSRTNVYTNSVRPSDGKVDPERPPTESQSKAANFYGVAADGLKTVEELEPKISAAELLAIQKLPLDGVAGYFAAPSISENAKRYLRAMNQFIEAEIRDKSGAAINASEYLADKGSYMMTQGETPKLAEDRVRSRRKVLDGIGQKAGPALNRNDLMPPPQGRKPRPE